MLEKNIVKVASSTKKRQPKKKRINNGEHKGSKGVDAIMITANCSIDVQGWSTRRGFRLRYRGGGGEINFMRSYLAILCYS